MSDFEHNNILTLDFVGKTVTNEDIYSESMVLSKSLCDESSLTFGKCNSACFKVKIFDEDNFQYKGMVVSPTLQIWDEDSQEYITNNLGTFTVESEQRTNDVHYKEITCYDKMYYFGKIDITEKLISRINESQMSSVSRHSVSGMFPSDPTISRNNRYMSKNKAVVKVSAADMKRGMSNGSGEIINGIEAGSVLNETIVFNKYPNGIEGSTEKINNFEPLNGLLEHILDEYNIDYEELPSYGNTIKLYGWKALMDNSTKYSLLDFIQFYAQLCGCFGFINRDNKLEFTVIGSSSSAREYTQDDYNQSGLNYQEVKTTVPTRVILESQLEKTLASRDYYYGTAEENFIFQYGRKDIQM